MPLYHGRYGRQYPLLLINLSDLIVYLFPYSPQKLDYIYRL